MLKLIQFSRRRLLAGACLLPLAGLAGTPARGVVDVWKSPACGCCKDWVVHMQANGFQVRVNDVSEAVKAAQRKKLGMPEQLGSCHTALVQGYVLEGHVPARDVQRLLSERPQALGLAVPGMPVGSPGMDGPAYGGHQDAYSVLLVQRDATTTVYRAYP